MHDCSERVCNDHPLLLVLSLSDSERSERPDKYVSLQIAMKSPLAVHLRARIANHELT